MSNCRLYLITPPIVHDIDGFRDQFEATLNGGDVACLQVRLKSVEGVKAPPHDIERVMKAILPVANERDVAVLLNDDPQLAKDLGADGVHIGQSDMPYRKARELLGDEASIGVTCHNSRHLALEAAEAGADYVAFGAFFSTTTKQASHCADPQLLEWWQDVTTVPCVAIGGITVENCEPLVTHGADFLAVSSGVWAHRDGPAEAVTAFNRIIAALAESD